MSDWMLYHVWRIRGYKVEHCERVEPERIVVTITATPQALRCARCGTRVVIRKGVNLRMLRGTPVGRTHVHFAVHVPRVHCRKCGLTRQVRLPFADEKRRHTRQFERYALELAQLTTTAHAARHLGVSRDTVRDIESRYLGKQYRKPKLKHLKQLAIDEIYLGKSVKFLTVVLDLLSVSRAREKESGAIVFIGRGKGAEALDPFLYTATSSSGSVSINCEISRKRRIFAACDHGQRTVGFGRPRRASITESARLMVLT